ncbi:MAG: GNAT family N-acetyltransferase [Proteobacteria bacterium]|uniref:GNAT family N-acetyltransferase n=1 Tax=Rudaea sp. TaxID=2136325 RepID=UPI00321F963B|nr:GNAT family N-acetyltransferase [Pseudomonadota bacterium]
MNTVANLRNLAERWALPRHGRGVRPPPRRSERRTPQRGADGGGERLTSRDGTPLVLRQIRPDDVEALQRFFHRLTPEEVRLRFLHPLNELPDAFAHQLCELDPAVAFAWLLATPDDPAHPDLPIEIHAVARAHLDPVLDQAEYAIVVEGRFARQGFGSLLMRRVIASARKLGATELWSDVLLENGAMLDLCAKLGFERGMSLNNPGVVRVSLAL